MPKKRFIVSVPCFAWADIEVSADDAQAALDYVSKRMYTLIDPRSVWFEEPGLEVTVRNEAETSNYEIQVKELNV